MLEFDASTHTYRFAGAVVPHVTGLLDHLHSFAGVPLDVLAAAKKRGSRTHAACQFFDENDLDEDDLRANLPDVWARLQGWKRFLADCEPNWSRIEARVYSHLHRYAGTLDREGELTVAGRRVVGAILDIKTSAAAHPVWGVQTAAYAAAAGNPKARRFTVQLFTDQTYKLLEWCDPHDWPVFVSLTTLHTWKDRHGI